MKFRYLLFLLIISLSACKKTEKVNKYYPSSAPFSFEAKDGVWEFYTSDQVLEQRYDYDNHNLLYYNTELIQRYTYWLKSDTTVRILDRPSMPIGGLELFMRNIARQFRIPADVRNSITQLRLDLAVTITQDGKATTVRPLNSVPQSIEQEMLRVLKTYPYDWIPAIYKGQAVDTEYRFSINIAAK